MKKNTLIILLLIILIFTAKQNALAKTPTPTVVTLQQQVDELKNRIASRVAELKLVEKRGVIGVVTEISGTQITLTGSNGSLKLIDVDELTKFSSPSSKSFGISDIVKGMNLGVLGLYNKQSRRILARQVDELPAQPKVIYGGVLEINDDDFEITIVNEKGQKTIVSIENITKTYTYQEKELAKSGFSKITEKEAVIAIGFPDKNDSKKIVASRLLLFPNIDITLRINFSIEEPNPTTPPSTGSGKKLFPITR